MAQNFQMRRLAFMAYNAPNCSANGSQATVDIANIDRILILYLDS